MESKSINWEKLGLYVAMITLIFMFWQAWRDIHKDTSDLKERVAKLEVITEKLESRWIGHKF